MSASAPPPGHQEGGGIFGSTRGFLAACAGYLSARLRLASMEGREAGVHALKLLALVLGALCVAVFGWLFLCLGVVFLLARAFSGEHAFLYASLTMAGAHLVLILWLAACIRSAVKKQVFPLTVAEFQKDQAWLETQKKQS